MLATPFYLAVGLTVGFVVGVNYAIDRTEPWKDLANSSTEMLLWFRRKLDGGPVPPSSGPEVPAAGVEVA